MGGRSSAIGTGRPSPRRNPWYSFSGAESTAGHMVLSEGTTEKNPQLHHREFEWISCSSSGGTLLYMQHMVFTVLNILKLCKITYLTIVTKSIKRYFVCKVSYYITRFFGCYVQHFTIALDLIAFSEILLLSKKIF